MVVLSRGSVHHRVTGRSVLIWPVDGSPVILDGLAADVWGLLAQPQTPEDVRAEMIRRYGADDRPLDQAITTAIDLVRPYTSADASRPDPVGQAVPDDVVLGPGALDRLRKWSQVTPREELAAMLAAQWSVGRGPPLLPPAELHWQDLNRCLRERVLAGLVTAVRRGAVDPGPIMVDHLYRMDREVQLHALRCEQALLQVVGCLEDLGIDHRVLKGLATAHLDFPSPELRQIGDVDLLVEAADHPAVVARLRSDGFRHIVGGDPGPFALYKSNYLIGPHNIEIDLHHRLFRHGRRPDKSLWRDNESFLVAGTAVTALGRPWRLVHAAAHAMFSGDGTSRLSMFLDPARILIDEPAVLDEALAIADRIDLRRVVATGLLRSCEIVGASAVVDMDAVASAGTGGTWRWRDAVAMWAFDQPERHVAREQLSLLGGLSPAQAARWLAAWVRPSADYQGESLARRLVSSVRSRSSMP